MRIRAMFSRRLWSTILLGASALLGGCARPSATLPAETSAEPLGVQMVRTEAQLSKYPFFNLLGFERDTDPVFVRTLGRVPSLDPSRSHTGTASLALLPGTRQLSINLAPLHSGREWPGRWTLIGAYFFATAPQQRLTATYDTGSAPLASCTVELRPGQWTPVLLDIAALPQNAAEPGVLRFAFPGSLPATVWCDDVLEIDNRTLLAGGGSSPWTVVERGFSYVLDRPGAFRLVLKTPEASDQDWVVQEANSVRARFISGSRQHVLTIYSDGRQFMDGEFRTSAGPNAESLSRQQATPAEITVAPDSGRLNRNSSGDANNDGYNEREGAYQLIASSARMEFTVSPRTTTLISPVLDIADLPPGRVLATMEGQLVENCVRLPGGHVLIQLPGALARPTSVNVRVAASAEVPQ